MIVPQWRQYILDLYDAGVEVVDLYPIFRDHKDDAMLFSKNHHISSHGAELIAGALSRYIKATTILGAADMGFAHKSITLPMPFADPVEVIGSDILEAKMITISRGGK